MRARKAGAFGPDGWREVDVSDPDVPQRALRVPYPAGSASPSASREHGAPGGGMQVFLPPVEGARDEAYLRYWVSFPRDFDFVKGGKLPGLWDGSQISGGAASDGTNGFSTRLTWRRGRGRGGLSVRPGRVGDEPGPGRLDRADRCVDMRRAACRH